MSGLKKREVTDSKMKKKEQVVRFNEANEEDDE